MMLGRSLFFVLMWTTFGSMCAFSQKLTAIKCGTLIDVQASKSITNAVILVLVPTKVENIRKAIQRGVKIAFGSDIVTMPMGVSAQEFRLHVLAGQTPMGATRSATIISAEALNMQNDVGSIEPGKFADIIAVEGNPLNDVTVLEKVSFVMKDGKVYRNLISR